MMKKLNSKSISRDDSKRARMMHMESFADTLTDGTIKKFRDCQKTWSQAMCASHGKTTFQELSTVVECVHKTRKDDDTRAPIVVVDDTHGGKWIRGSYG